MPSCAPCGPSGTTRPIATPSWGPNPVRLKRQWLPVQARTGHVRFDRLPSFFKAVAGLRSPTARDYILLILFTGLRRREASALSWADVDLEAGVLRIPQEKAKGGRRVDLPITTFVAELLAARRNPTDHVFPTRSRSGHIDGAKKALAEVAEATGFAVTHHDLRRTYATVAATCAIPYPALKALLSHATGTDVTSNYIQVTVEQLRGPAQQVCDRVMALCRCQEVLPTNK